MREELERCDRELARIAEEAATGKHPAWLIAMGVNDWEFEKKLIISEREALHGTKHTASEPQGVLNNPDDGRE